MFSHFRNKADFPAQEAVFRRTALVFPVFRQAWKR
jgi:hypothetical protein